MAYNEKQKEYAMDYAKRTLKRIPLDVKKEYYENVIVPEAEKYGLSVRAFILEQLRKRLKEIVDTIRAYSMLKLDKGKPLLNIRAGQLRKV